MDDDFRFDRSLEEGIVIKRSSIYTMLVDVGGKQVSCHCPTKGRIGNIDVAGRPCLLSASSNPERKTPYTVEAISLDRPETKDKSWIGINQNAANRYVEHYLRNGGLSDVIGTGDVQRERFLGQSKLDFLVGDNYLEVKTPLQHLQVDIPDYIRVKKTAPFSSTDRMTRHMQELAGSLQSHQKAVLLIVFIYDNPGFRVVERSTNYDEVKRIIDECVSKGVEIWQANFSIDRERVRLERHFRLEL